jgi:hypothetical protein
MVLERENPGETNQSEKTSRNTGPRRQTIPRRTGYNISDRERGATLQHIQKRDPESERKIDPDDKNQHWHVNRK